MLYKLRLHLPVNIQLGFEIDIAVVTFLIHVASTVVAIAVVFVAIHNRYDRQELGIWLPARRARESIDHPVTQTLRGDLSVGQALDQTRFMVHVGAPAAGCFDRYRKIVIIIVGVGASVYVVDYRVTSLEEFEANDAFPVEVA